MERRHKFFTLSGLVLGVGFTALAFGISSKAMAADITPSFNGAPTDWSVDRYAPDSFADIGSFMGRDHVLGIGIGPNGATANRGPSYSSSFYNTQGMSHSISGGAGDILQADLYVPGSWESVSNGSRRTDIWGVMTDGTTTITGYPLLGFTNNGADSYVGFEAWNDTTGVWVNLSSVVNYDAWNTLGFEFDGTDYNYYVNGALATSIAAESGTTTFDRVIMQAYNFDGSDYTVDYNNVKVSAVPEPGSLIYLSGLTGMIGLMSASGMGKFRQRFSFLRS